MPQKNLFIAFTPYHFIIAYSICREEYSERGFDNQIYYLKSDRTNYLIDLSKDDFNGRVIRFEKSELVDLVKKLEKQEFFRFFFFQENSILNKYLAYKLKKNGTIICLGPDGTKPYGEFNKTNEILTCIKDTVKDYRFLLQNDLILPKLLWSRYYKYGATVLLDEVWLQYPKLFNRHSNETKGNIITIAPLNQNHISRLMQICNFSTSLIQETKNVILYFNQPFYHEEFIDREFEILESLSINFPNRNINVKLHPSTNPEVIKKMRNLPYLTLINDNLPAEFYLGLVSDSIFISGWSTALMHNLGEQNNKSYFLYPMYKDVKNKTMSQITILGFPHVKMVDNFSEILFANE